VAILIGHITGLARPSIYLSVLYGLLTQIQKKQNNQNWHESSSGQKDPQLAQKVKGQG